MGYTIKSKKINILLTPEQQNQIYAIWMSFLDDINPKTIWLHYMDNEIKYSQPKDIEDILNLLKFTYVKKSKKLKIESYYGAMKDQITFFDAISHVITPGNHVTWRGEDSAIFGWFFNSTLLSFDSYQELKKLQMPFEMKKTLEKELTVKNLPSNTLRIKI